jgi:glycerol-3-phosphate cytidylyltransferase-like family protein
MPQADREMLYAALTPVAEAFQTMPGYLILRCVTSLVVSWVMNSDDPVAAFVLVIEESARGIDMATEQQRERGGTA